MYLETPVLVQFKQVISTIYVQELINNYLNIIV